jgi:hypothetical protein
MSQMSIDLEGWDLHRAAEENRVEITRALITRGDYVDVLSKKFVHILITSGNIRANNHE